MNVEMMFPSQQNSMPAIMPEAGMMNMNNMGAGMGNMGGGMGNMGGPMGNMGGGMGNMGGMQN